MIEKEDVRRSEPERDWTRGGWGARGRQWRGGGVGGVGGWRRVVKQIAVVISFVTSAKSCRRP